MQTLNEALSRRTVPELKILAALLPPPARVGNKDLIISSITACLEGPALRLLWDSLDALQKLAVAECLHAAQGVFDSRQFAARYGALPLFNQPPAQDKRRHSHYSQEAGPPTRLRLFLHPTLSNRSQLLTLPMDLHARLQAFVPAPEAPSLATTAVLPEKHDDAPLVQRSNERDALADLALLLRLADQGQLPVSDKTALASAATLRLVTEKLSGGDYYASATSAEDGTPIGAIKAFAWPLLLHAAGLVQAKGSKSALSPAGRKALLTPAAEVLKGLWQKWLKTNLLDEFNRVDQVKGQKSKGPVMTAVAPRRSAIAMALQQCPVGAWVAVDELGRFMQADELGFEVTHDPWKLYLADPEYGRLGYAGSHGWDILQLRYLMCFLFEYAAVLGLVDLAYVEPWHAHQNYQRLWGADQVPFLSRYDGLLYIRLTPLGAYCLGATNSYSPTAAPSRAALSVLPSLTVRLQRGPLAPEEAALLETWAQPISDTAWLLDAQKAVAAVERGLHTQELEDFLRSRDEQPLPPTVEAFIRHSQAMGQALRVLGPALLIECVDAQVASRIAKHPESASLCSLVGDNRLVVRSEHIERFRSKLRLLGFGMLG